MTKPHADIAARHRDIPQDALPLDVPLGGGPPKRRASSVRSVAHGHCPVCPGEKVGQVHDGDQLVWRDHTRTTLGGARIRCSASGKPVN